MLPMDERQHRWLAVYGSALALQASSYLRDRADIPIDMMERFMREAENIANLEASLAPPPAKVTRLLF